MRKLSLFVFIIFSLPASSMPLKKCYDYYKSKMIRSTGSNVFKSVLLPITLLFDGRGVIQNYKNNHKIHKNMKLLQILAKGKKGGWPLDSIAKETGVTNAEAIGFAKKNTDKLCNNRVLAGTEFPVESFTSMVMIKKYEKNFGHLLDGKSGPTFEKLFVPFVADPNWKKRGNPFKDCRNRRMNNYPIKIDKNKKVNTLRYQLYEIDPKCTPDVLYNWTTPTMIKAYKDKWGKNNRNWKAFSDSIWAGKQTYLFYGAFSPIASFYFGRDIVRVRLKEGTRFIIADPPPPTESQAPYCKNLPDRLKHNSVFLWYRSAGSLEYDLCSFEAVHSWSYGLKENYDEIVKDYLWFKSLGRSKVGKYFAYLHPPPFGNPTIFNVNLNKKTETDFMEIVGYHLGNVLLGKGEIFFNPNIPNADKTQLKHFKLDKKIYWGKY